MESPDRPDFWDLCEYGDALWDGVGGADRGLCWSLSASVASVSMVMLVLCSCMACCVSVDGC